MRTAERRTFFCWLKNCFFAPRYSQLCVFCGKNFLGNFIHHFSPRFPATHPETHIFRHIRAIRLLRACLGGHPAGVPIDLLRRISSATRSGACSSRRRLVCRPPMARPSRTQLNIGSFGTGQILFALPSLLSFPTQMTPLIAQPSSVRTYFPTIAPWADCASPARQHPLHRRPDYHQRAGCTTGRRFLCTCHSSSHHPREARHGQGTL